MKAKVDCTQCYGEVCKCPKFVCGKCKKIFPYEFRDYELNDKQCVDCAQEESLR